MEDLAKKLGEILENKPKHEQMEATLEKILDKLENQERKMGKIEEDLDSLNTLTEDEKDHFKKMIERIEAIVQNSEYFTTQTNTFERRIDKLEELFSAKMEGMEKRLENSSHQAKSDLLQRIVETEKELKGKIENEEESMQNLADKMQSLDGLKEKLDKFNRDIQEKIDLFTKKSLMEIKGGKSIDLSANSKKIEIEGSPLTCRNCRSDLPKTLTPRGDGVSVECPQCRQDNIVAKLNAGHRWLRAPTCNHFQQIPITTKTNEIERCQVCGKEGTLTDTNQFALPRGAGI